MVPLTIRRPFKFYLITAFMLLFPGILGIRILWGTSDAINMGRERQSDYVFFVIGLGLIFLAIFSFLRYFKNTPVIHIDAGTITFGREVYETGDIEDVQLTGKVPFPLIIPFRMEGASIQFKDGTTKYIYDDLYANGWQAKSFLEQVVVEKKLRYASTFAVSDSFNPDLRDMEVFKGHPVFSFRGLMLWGLIGFCIFLTFFGERPTDSKVTMFFIALSVFWFLGISGSMNYFGLTDQYFIVKNHHFFWKQHVYEIANIKEVVFETHSKAPNILRIITKDFHGKLYPAGTLLDKHWLALMDKLQEKGVPVRNECINLTG